MLRKLLPHSTRLKSLRNRSLNLIDRRTKTTALRIHQCCVHTGIKPKDSPTLQDFMAKAEAKLVLDSEPTKVPYLDPETLMGNNQKGNSCYNSLEYLNFESLTPHFCSIL